MSASLGGNLNEMVVVGCVDDKVAIPEDTLFRVQLDKQHCFKVLARRGYLTFTEFHPNEDVVAWIQDNTPTCHYTTTMRQVVVAFQTAEDMAFFRLTFTAIPYEPKFHFIKTGFTALDE